MSVISNRYAPRIFQAVLGGTLVLNGLDAALTILVVGSGAATEANPLMDELLAQSPLLFAIVKLSLVSLGVLLLWRLRERPLAWAGSVGVLAAYAGVMLQHAMVLRHVMG